MQTEEKLIMMKLAGLEIVTEPAGKGLRIAKVYGGHICLSDGAAYPEDAQDSMLDIIFHFYLLGTYAEMGAYKEKEEAEKRKRIGNMVQLQNPNSALAPGMAQIYNNALQNQQNAAMQNQQNQYVLAAAQYNANSMTLGGAPLESADTFRATSTYKNAVQQFRDFFKKE